VRWLAIVIVGCASSPPPRALHNRSESFGTAVDVPIAYGTWKLYGGARLEANAISLDLCGEAGAESARSSISLKPGVWQVRAEHANTDCTTGTELRATKSGQFLASAVLWSMHGSAETTRFVLAMPTEVDLDIGAFGGKGCCGTTSVYAISFVRQ
jgi:hypothetical protein